MSKIYTSINEKSSMCLLLSSLFSNSTEYIMKTYPIPLAFHDDAVFKRYVCQITHEPIRYPVEDPTTRIRQNQDNQDNPILYEKAAITASLAINALSPMTREPLTANQLIDRPDIELIIKDRLKYHTSHLLQYLEASPLLQQNLQIN